MLKIHLETFSQLINIKKEEYTYYLRKMLNLYLLKMTYSIIYKIVGQQQPIKK